MLLEFLDPLVNYQDTSLPSFSKLTYLYLACLLSSFLIAWDSIGRSRKTREAMVETVSMSEFTTVGVNGRVESAC